MATDRTESFSDGVFAFAVTLLVLDLGVHHVRPGGLAARARRFRGQLVARFLDRELEEERHELCEANPRG
jgi:Endosomal/lysosomal potassium channel TMEM175